MNIKLLSLDENKSYGNEILNMLELCDKEFVPPLSLRSSTTQRDLKSGEENIDGVKSYFEEVMKQHLMVATENEKLLGFVSFKENFTNDKISENELPDIYISTIIVHPEGRGRGLTKKMYKILFDEYKDVNIFTRTWSLNTAHIKILKEFGFETFSVLENDRGEGIDTVYFIKRATK